MLYAFFLFWPANVLPIWLLVTLLQLFIPLNLLVRGCCVKVALHKTHIAAGIIIFCAVAVNILLFIFEEYKSEYAKYSLLFMLSSACDVVSHSIKENIVRSQPLNQNEFNLKIAISQLIVGIIITPAILKYSAHQEHSEIGTPVDVGSPPFYETDNGEFWTFFGNYFRYGYACIFAGEQGAINNPNVPEACAFAIFPLIGYVSSLFVLQLTLTTLFQAKRFKNSRLIFSVMVPMTTLAFVLASVSCTNGLIPLDAGIAPSDSSSATAINTIALLLASLGVFMYNWFEEKPQSASIEKFGKEIKEPGKEF